jgi:DNA-binding transcriptional LysR family regulator
MMELRVLRYFLAVAREQSISGAANALHITQPALSRQLMDLEQELGAKLLIRGSRGKSIELTEAGKRLRLRAEEMIALADRTVEEFSEQEADVSGVVYLGAGETEGIRLLANAAARLREIHPRVRFHLYSGIADDVTERLDQGLLDFGVLVGESALQKYDYLSLPASDVWGVLVQSDPPLAAQERVRAKDLRSEPLIVSRQALQNNELTGWLGKKPEELNVVASYNLLLNAVYFVKAGLGSALCIDGLADTSRNELCFRPLDPPLRGQLRLVWKKHQIFSKAAKLFLEELQAELKRSFPRSGTV